jgi:hypothetical protein
MWGCVVSVGCEHGQAGYAPRRHESWRTVRRCGGMRATRATCAAWSTSCGSIRPRSSGSGHGSAVRGKKGKNEGLTVDAKVATLFISDRA